MPSVAGADVVIVVVDDVDGRLFRGPRAAVDPGVMRDKGGLFVRAGPLILGLRRFTSRSATMAAQSPQPR